MLSRSRLGAILSLFVLGTSLFVVGGGCRGEEGDEDCTGWGVDGKTARGARGSVDATDGDWINNTAEFCDNSAHLYCIDGQ